MSKDLEELAKNLLADIQSSDVKEIVISSDARPNSISKAEFEELKSILNELAPGVRVPYKHSV